jgi:hypothetical protein
LLPCTGDVIAKLLRRVGVSKKCELTCLFEDEHSAIEHSRQRAVGRRVTLVSLGLNGQRADNIPVFV